MSMTGQEKCDLLIKVSAWTGLTIIVKSLLCLSTVGIRLSSYRQAINNNDGIKHCEMI